MTLPKYEKTKRDRRSHIELNEKHERFLPTKTDLQYINPYWHRDLLLTTAEADRKTFAERFESIFALSLRVDGAVDKQRIDNKHVMSKYIITTEQARNQGGGSVGSYEPPTRSRWSVFIICIPQAGLSQFFFIV